MRPLPILLLLAGLSGCTALRESFSAPPGPRLAQSVTITRDEWGVPHVEGATDASVAFGIAWAMAEDNYWQIEEDYLADLGRAAHWYGEARLGADLVRAAFEVERHARAQYAAEPAERRRIWDAFAAGLNHYLSSHPQVLRRIIHHYEPWMVFARHRAGRAADTIDGFALAELAARHGAEVPAPAPSITADGASRAWAVAPARSAAGRAALVASRSAPFFGRGQLYELQLRSGEGWHVAGVAELGTPVPSAGWNAQLAWTHTARSGTGDRVQRIILDPAGDTLAWTVDGERRRVTQWTDTVHVNTAAGVQARAFTFLRTDDGPVIARRGDTAVVAVLAGGTGAGPLGQWYEMGKATSLETFRAALARGALPGRATLYADAAGNILYAAGEQEVLNPASGMLTSRGLAAADVAIETEPAAGPLDSAGLAALAFDSRVAAPTRVVAQVVHEWEQIGATNPGRAAALDPAIERLRSWDGVVTVESQAAPLYVQWREHAVRTTAGAFPEFRALEAATAQLRRGWGGDMVTWGELNRLLRTHTGGTELFRDDAPGLPLRAVPAAAGAAFVAEYEADTGRRRFARRGTAWVAVIEPGSPPRARTITVFGQSADPASPHFFDQAPRFAEGVLKAAWFMPEEVRARAVRSYAPVAGTAAPAETGAPPAP